MIALSINLNKIALLRNSRDTNFPDPVEFGRRCIDLGCQGITVHPRPDMRHIRPDDVGRLCSLTSEHRDIEYNIEGNPFAKSVGDYPGFVELVLEHTPNQVTLVPDSDDQLTSDHGFDLRRSGEALKPIIERFQDQGIRVSLFMDPNKEQIQLAKDVGADRIELYTGPYAESFLNQTEDFADIHRQFFQAAETAQSLRLGVNAGHDLNLDNLAEFVKIPHLMEVSIGHAFTVDALLMGIDAAMGAYLNALS